MPDGTSRLMRFGVCIVEGTRRPKLGCSGGKAWGGRGVKGLAGLGGSRGIYACPAHACPAAQRARPRRGCPPSGRTKTAEDSAV